jgi:hypothetical protein
VGGDHSAAKGKRHIILVNPTEAPKERSGYEQLLSAVKQSRAIVHVASQFAHADLENLAQWSEGQFRLAADPEQLQAAVLELYLSLTARYSVTYKPVLPEVTRTTIAVCAPSGVGEARLPI